MNMHGPNFLENVIELVEDGKLDIKRIDESARKILYAKFKLGLFENRYVDEDNISKKIFNESHKETALKLLDQDIAEMDNISNRWMNDMRSDSWLSKNTRPLTLIFLTFAMTIFVILDSTVLLEIKTGWVSLLEALLITVYVAYFGSRGAEKITKIKN